MIELLAAVGIVLLGVVAFLMWRFRTDVRPQKEPTDEDRIRALAAQGVKLSEVYERFPHLEPEYIAEIYSSRGMK